MSTNTREIAEYVLSRETWSSGIRREYALNIIEQAIMQWFEDNEAVIYRVQPVDRGEEDVVEISVNEYAILARDSEFLDALRAAGVDNWNGYSEACRMMREENDHEG